MFCLVEYGRILESAEELIKDEGVLPNKYAWACAFSLKKRCIKGAPIFFVNVNYSLCMYTIHITYWRSLGVYTLKVKLRLHFCD